MEETQLEIEIQLQILQRLDEAKTIIEKQTKILENILIKKAMESYKDIEKEKLKDIFSKIFTVNMCEELDALFDYYKISELEFYKKNLRTADLIFNSLNAKHTQKIYLENLIKKIHQKEKEDIEKVFTESAKNRLNQEDEEQHLSINNIFSKIVRIVIKNRRLSLDESNDLYNVAIHYYEMYKNDMKLAINHFLDENKQIVIQRIEEEMNNREISVDKTMPLSSVQIAITNNALKAMEKLLENTTNKYKEIAKKDLKSYSSVMTDFVFKLLPFEFKNKKELLEIIIDTNINERLGKLLDDETKKYTDSIKVKNKNVVENEFSEEKRYKKIDEYECDFKIVEEVYKDILREIKTASNIPNDEEELKRLNLLVHSEINSTKTVLKNLIDNIRDENNKNLKAVIIVMNNMNEKSKEENTDNNKTSSGYKK